MDITGGLNAMKAGSASGVCSLSRLDGRSESAVSPPEIHTMKEPSLSRVYLDEDVVGKV